MEKYMSGLASIWSSWEVEIHRTRTARAPPGNGSVSSIMTTSSATSSAKTHSKKGPADDEPIIVRRCVRFHCAGKAGLSTSKFA